MVTGIVTGPGWFFGIDSMLEAVSMLICLSVFAFSYKVYKLTKEKRHLYFSLAFGLLTLAFLVRSATNLIIHFRTVSDLGMRSLPDIVVAKGILSVGKIFLYGYGLHIAFTLTALALLAILCLKVEDKKPFFLMLLLMFVLVYFSSSYFTTFYVLSLILLFFISYQYCYNWRLKRTATTLITFFAFSVLALSSLSFLLQKFFGGFYAVAYILQFGGFLAISVALAIIIFKK